MSEMDEDLVRFRLLGEVFRQLPEEFAGMALAPLTAGRWDLLRKRQNAFLFSTGVEEDGEEGDDEALMYGTAEFLWVHCAPVAEVLAANRAGEERWREKVEEFAMEHCDFGSILEFAEAFRERMEELGAAVIAVEEEGGEPGGEGKQERSHTGSRAMSGHSEGTSRESGGNGSSGSCRTPRGSSMSTARSEREGRSADGRSISGQVSAPMPAREE